MSNELEDAIDEMLTAYVNVVQSFINPSRSSYPEARARVMNLINERPVDVNEIAALIKEGLWNNNYVTDAAIKNAARLLIARGYRKHV